MNKEMINMVMRALNGSPTVAKSKVADEVENTLNKQIPKKPTMYVTKFPHCCKVSECPTCGQEFGFNDDFNYCENCGQKIDWGNEE